MASKKKSTKKKSTKTKARTFFVAVNEYGDDAFISTVKPKVEVVRSFKNVGSDGITTIQDYDGFSTAFLSAFGIESDNDEALGAEVKVTSIKPISDSKMKDGMVLLTVEGGSCVCDGVCPSCSEDSEKTATLRVEGSYYDRLNLCSDAFKQLTGKTLEDFEPGEYQVVCTAKAL
jgi:hypothetical protein